MTTYTPSYREDNASKVPALLLLQNLGWTYLRPGEAQQLRGGRLGEVILEGVLTPMLRELNWIESRGERYAFTEGNIQAAVEALKSEPFDGLVTTNKRLYELLTLGKALPQSIGGDTKSHTLRYIDWDRPERNAFHVAEEFAVERTGSHDKRVPDLVLFVNGIPLAVIECKASTRKDPLGEAIAQHLRNQNEDEIPRLFLYAQLLLALATSEAKYGTVGTQPKFWSVWREKDADEAELRELVNRPAPESNWDKLFGDGELHEPSAGYFTSLAADDRELTAQDRLLHALCRPARLLELVRGFIVFDAGTKKVARYQQYFAVRKAMDRIRGRDPGGVDPAPARGGVIWHTQGSGKSLTMVFLAKALGLAPDVRKDKIVIVTDRVNLDEQIGATFRNTGHDVVQARSGWNLGELLTNSKAEVITTVIDKFEAAVGKAGVRNESPDIFVLVDEGHRSHYGTRHAKMRKALPNACYIGFTGTPLMRDEKNTARQFGGIIDTYTIDEAVQDKAVVPLLYESRYVPQIVDAVPLDQWFDNYTAELTPEQRADLKKRCSGTSQLQKSRQTIMRIAWDVSTHYRDHWQGTGFKAQLVTMSKAAALQYKAFLDEFDMVTSEVLISPPDDREGTEDAFSGNRDEIVKFWQAMMRRFGSEREYNREIRRAFTCSEEPEIIIVVDKLLTGFDAPRNRIMYLHKPLQGHSLLQAIARVNRVYEGKDAGQIIDYYGVLSKLDEALDLYGGLPDVLDGFDEGEVGAALTDIQREIGTLPQRHSDVWQVFVGIRNRQDSEAFELHLADDALRAQFYERLSTFARTLQLALSSYRFHEDTPEARVATYRDDLKFFCNLRTAVRRRYAEAVDFGEYERRIQKLIDQHVGAGEVEQLTQLVDIFDTEAFAREVERVTGTASKADTIAHRTKKTLEEKWRQEDPAFYRKFSRMLQDAIDAFHQRRISDTEYLARAKDIQGHVVTRTGDDLPGGLDRASPAAAFYGMTEEPLARHQRDNLDLPAVRAEIAAGIDEIVRRLRIVNWENNTDCQNRMRTAIEDFLFEIKDARDIDLTLDEIDTIMEGCLDVAKWRYRT